jgi:hypothetical protein
MTLTVSIKRQSVAGDLRRTIADCTCDTSYPTGGYAVTPGNFGFPGGSIVWADTGGGTSGGYVSNYDYTANKIKLFRQTAATGALVEVPNTTNVATETFRAHVLISGS